MGEVVTFPTWNIQAGQKESNLGAHFESEIEAAEAIQEEVYRTRNWFERNFVMSAPELVEYLNATREKIEQASLPPVVENANVIPLQKQAA